MRFCSALLLSVCCASGAFAQAVDFSNGCGTGWNLAVVPNSPLGYAFKSACDAHDNCYSRCLKGGQNFENPEKCDQTAEVKESRRKLCDVDFRARMDDICQQYRGEALCRTLSKIYYIAVSMGGSGSFNGYEVQNLIARMQKNPLLDTTDLQKQLDAAIAGKVDASKLQIHVRVGNDAVQSWSSPRMTVLQQIQQQNRFEKSTVIDVRRDDIMRRSFEREVQTR